MLSVIVHLVAAATILLRIMMPIVQIELDSLNDPTSRPIPEAFV